MTKDNNNKARRVAALLLAVAMVAVAAVAQPADSIAAAPADSAAIAPADTVAIAKKRPGLFKRIMDYFTETEEEELAARNKRVRFSVLGGPSYSGDSKLGIGLAGVINFRTKGSEYPMQPSTAMVFASISTEKFWTAGVRSISFFKGEKIRLNCDIDFSYSPRRYWGVGYEKGNVNDGYIKLKEYDIFVVAEWLWRVRNNLYLGPAVRWDYVNGGSNDHPEYFNGQDVVTRNYGVGLVAVYDSRDVIQNAYSGWYVYLGQMFRPKWLGNDYAFSTTELRLSHYRKAWTGAVIAAEVRSKFNFGNPSWAMMSLFGDNYTMRGYYKGRYRDKHIVTAQLEVRQHIWKSIGMVAWGGAGSVFHDTESFKHWLPNFGVGARWEFRNRINVRLDYGFGKRGQSTFIFSINEAF